MKRDLVVTIGEQARAVTIDGPLPGTGASGATGAGGQFEVTIDGVSQVVDARAIRPGTWSLMLSGRAVIVDLDKRRAGVAASVGDSEALLTVEDARAKRLAAAAPRRERAKGESLRAPIAGKVVKVLVEVGEVVVPGHAVLVLEAMKMENELRAERGGTVSALKAVAGQAVDTGDLLVELT
jgi:biotin carboxyl carrier protein